MGAVIFEEEKPKQTAPGEKIVVVGLERLGEKAGDKKMRRKIAKSR